MQVRPVAAIARKGRRRDPQRPVDQHPLPLRHLRHHRPQRRQREQPPPAAQRHLDIIPLRPHMQHVPQQHALLPDRDRHHRLGRRHGHVPCRAQLRQHARDQPVHRDRGLHLPHQHRKDRQRHHHPWPRRCHPSPRLPDHLPCHDHAANRHGDDNRRAHHHAPPAPLQRRDRTDHQNRNSQRRRLNHDMRQQLPPERDARISDEKERKQKRPAQRMEQDHRPMAENGHQLVKPQDNRSPSHQTDVQLVNIHLTLHSHSQTFTNVDRCPVPRTSLCRNGA